MTIRDPELLNAGLMTGGLLMSAGLVAMLLRRNVFTRTAGVLAAIAGLMMMQFAFGRYHGRLNISGLLVTSLLMVWSVVVLRSSWSENQPCTEVEDIEEIPPQRVTLIAHDVVADDDDSGSPAEASDDIR